MAAWTAQINTVTPQGGNLNIAFSYFLATDTGFTTPLGTDSVILPNTTALIDIRKQIVAQGNAFRTSASLQATYQGQTINIP